MPPDLIPKPRKGLPLDTHMETPRFADAPLCRATLIENKALFLGAVHSTSDAQHANARYTYRFCPVCYRTKKHGLHGWHGSMRVCRASCVSTMVKWTSACTKHTPYFPQVRHEQAASVSLSVGVLYSYTTTAKNVLTPVEREERCCHVEQVTAPTPKT